MLLLYSIFKAIVMKQLCETLYLGLMDKLQNTAINESNTILKAKKNMSVVKEAVWELKEHVLSNSFNNSREEIEFFKHIQPLFVCEFFYYHSIAILESRIPAGSKEDRMKFYSKELKGIKNFFDLNIDVYMYYRSEADYLDEQYFLRSSSATGMLLEDSALLYDPIFATSMSQKFARIKANEKLENYLRLKIDELNDVKPQVPHPLKWSGKKVLLAEVIYMFYANGVFGTQKLKLICDTITRDWNCPLPNIWKTFEEIRIRKKNRLSGLEELLEGTERKMEEDDERGS
jgi:hypothetical protein